MWLFTHLPWLLISDMPGSLFAFRGKCKATMALLEILRMKPGVF